jgi:hypothetical protein
MADRTLTDQDVPGPRRDYVGYGRRLPRVRWPHDARVALSLVLNYEEGSEASFPAGDGYSEGGMAELAWSLPKEVRDLAAESIYEYGSRAGVWRLARIFEAAKIPVTVYASAVALERNQEFAAWIREEGHEACAHGWRWEQTWRFRPPGGEGAHLGRRRLDHSDRRGSGRAAGPAATARPSIPASCCMRSAASSTTRTRSTTTCHTIRRSRDSPG